jgi:hypothetical protein
LSPSGAHLGQIVAIYFTCDSNGNIANEVSFLHSAGRFTPIIYPGAVGYAFGINNGRQLVGNYQGMGFLYSGGSFSSITYPGVARRYTSE